MNVLLSQTLIEMQDPPVWINRELFLTKAQTWLMNLMCTEFWQNTWQRQQWESGPWRKQDAAILLDIFQYFGHLMPRADSLEKSLMIGKIEGRRRRRQQKMRLLDSITNTMYMSLSKLREIVKDRKAWHVAVHGVAKSWTWLSGWLNNSKDQMTV